MSEIKVTPVPPGPALPKGRYELWQDGLMVAAVDDATDPERGYREIIRYAFMYALDGPVTVRGVHPEIWEKIHGAPP